MALLMLASANAPGLCMVTTRGALESDEEIREAVSADAFTPIEGWGVSKGTAEAFASSHGEGLYDFPEWDEGFSFEELLRTYMDAEGEASGGCVVFGG